MVMIMITSWYPPSKAIEAAEKYIEMMQKIPDDPSILETLVTVGVNSCKDGIEAISIGNVKKGKFEEAMNFVLRRMVMFHGIEGYRYEIKTLSTLEEAMPLVGLSPP